MLSNLSRLAGHADLARRAYQLRQADSDAVRRAARRHLVQRMGKMRGLPQKLGQMLSFSHRDSEAGADFAPLFEDAEPLAWNVIASELTQAWQRPWQDVLRTVDTHGLAASLGQVHRAVLHDGREVAVKVQYPGIGESVLADLSLLGWMSAPLGGLQRGFDVAGYRQTIREDLERELDYIAEAAQQRLFARALQGSLEVIVPQVIDAWSTDRVLMTTWESGDAWPVMQEHGDEDARRVLGNRLVTWFLKCLFRDGLVHADLHPGNVRFRQTDAGPQWVLYDFGCTYRPTETERLALLRLIQGTCERSENPWPLFLALGFDEQYLEPLAAKLPALCQVLFEPFLSTKPYDARQWRLGERVADILGEDRWNFRIAGPPALVLLLRAFHGLKFYLEGLRTAVVWQRPFSELWAELQHQADALTLPAAPRPDADFTQLSRYLKIRVREAGSTKVELTCPALAVDDLESMIDDDLLRRIRSQGSNLAQLAADVRRRGYAPGPVFAVQHADKEVSVWLE